MKEQEIKDILEKQREFFRSGETISVEFRLRQLEKLRKSMVAHEDDLTEALKKDLGKVIWRVSCVRLD